MHRRAYLTAVGTVGVAGCLGDSDDDGDDGGTDEFDVDTSSPTAVVESWFPIFVEADLETVKELAPQIFHSQAPRLDSIQRQEEQQNFADNEFEGVESSVVAEDLSAEQFRMRSGFLSDDVIATIVETEQSAEVEATYRLTTAEGYESEQPMSCIVATEDGEWQILTATPRDL